MQKILILFSNFLLILLSVFAAGCESSSINDFKKKSYDEYYTSLENTTIEMELVVDNKRAICFYTNDSKTFIFTIKYQYSSEYGYLYNTVNNELYCLENQVITQKKINSDAEEAIWKLYNSNNILFHLQFDYSEFEYIGTVTICNRECNKYRFIDQLNGEEATFNIYIDNETGFCLKGVCVVDDSTKIYFEAKKFIKEANIQPYIDLINKYEKNTQ